MTLKWFNSWRFPDAFPRVCDVNLDTTKFADAKAVVNTVPANTNPPSGNGTDNTQPPTGTPQVGTVSFFDRVVGPTSRDAPPANSDMTLAGLWTDGDQFRKVLYKVVSNGSQIIIRGLLADNVSVTQDLMLPLSGTTIQMYKNSNQLITAGQLDTTQQIITLCSRAYGTVCQLNYDAGSGALVAGLTQGEFEREDSVPPYNWKSVAVAGYGLDFSVADV